MGMALLSHTVVLGQREHPPGHNFRMGAGIPEFKTHKGLMYVEAEVDIN